MSKNKDRRGYWWIKVLTKHPKWEIAYHDGTEGKDCRSGWKFIGPNKLANKETEYLVGPKIENYDW